VVDVYQGPAACLVLEAHTGVCWAAVDRGETVVVDDVHSFPGHIACDERTRSEIVVPIVGSDGRATGVLDVDSRREAHFDRVDREGYESIIRMLEERWHV
jgi:GAF domain-containing protein